MAQKVDAMVEKMIANLPEKTGKSLDQWLKIVSQSKLQKHMEILKFLKSEHGVTHGFANLIASRALQSSSPAGDGTLVDNQYSGAKEAIRPLYESLVATIGKFGDDVEVAPKKAYVSLRRKKQFAILQPSTKDRLDVGINLKGREPTDRLEASGSFNAMVSHRVRVTKKSQLNAELKKWLKEAYDAAG